MLPPGSQRWAGQAGKSGSSSGALRGEPGPRPCLSACNKRPHFSAVLCPRLFHKPAPPSPGHLLPLCRAHCVQQPRAAAAAGHGARAVPVGLLLSHGASAVLWGFCCPVGCCCPVGLPGALAGAVAAARSMQHAARSGRALLVCCLLRRSFGAPGKARRCEHQGQICTMQRQSVAFRL